MMKDREVLKMLDDGTVFEWDEWGLNIMMPNNKRLRGVVGSIYEWFSAPDDVREKAVNWLRCAGRELPRKAGWLIVKDGKRVYVIDDFNLAYEIREHMEMAEKARKLADIERFEARADKIARARKVLMVRVLDDTGDWKLAMRMLDSRSPADAADILRRECGIPTSGAISRLISDLEDVAEIVSRSVSSGKVSGSGYLMSLKEARELITDAIYRDDDGNGWLTDHVLARCPDGTEIGSDTYSAEEQRVIDEILATSWDNGNEIESIVEYGFDDDETRCHDALPWSEEQIDNIKAKYEPEE